MSADNDKIALVTGSSSGIGAGIAKMLAEMGCKVIIVGRREEYLHRIRTDIEGAGGTVTSVAVDLSDRDQVNELIDRLFEDYGPPDILVNCAGRVDADYIHELDMAHWDAVIELNLRVPAMLCASVLPSMRERGRGFIINVSSEAGLYTYEGMGAYTVSKHALCTLTELVQKENQALGIKAWAICPGDVLTERTGAISSEKEASRFLRVEDITRVIHHLLTQRDNVQVGPNILIRPMLNPYE
jgi:3-oxoacyl-[acyl-carrier protein] reductase